MKNGKKYNKYISKSSCTRTDLGKGDTFFTVRNMRDWVLQDYKQVQKLAQILKKPTLAATVASIHRFLYDHIAYKADGALQVVKSPGCTWATRKEGTDCKTFSVFASSLLLNLNIPHAIRQVRQPGSKSDLWTHVYVVIPSNPSDTRIKGNYFVLDGTLATNQEVMTVETNDEFMPELRHIGLRGATRTGYNRVTTGLTGVANQGFENFLTALINTGVTARTIEAIRNEVYKYTSQGVDPSFKITGKGVFVQGTLFVYSYNSIINRSVAGGLANANTTTTNDQTGETIAQVSQQILESNFFANTFGAIFQNGFDVSCWNSSMSPSRAQEIVKQDFPYLLDQSGIKGAITLGTIDKLFKTLEIYRQGFINIQRSKFAKCTREGGKKGQKIVEEFIKFMIPAVEGSLAQNGKRLVQQGTRAESGDFRLKIKSSWSGGNIVLKGRTFNFKKLAIVNQQNQLDVTSNPGLPNIPLPTNTNTPSNSIPTVINTPNGQGFSASNGGLITPQLQTASLGNVVGLLLVSGIGYGAYKASKSKSSKNK